MLMTASRGICPFKGGFECSVHTVLGAVIITASVADLALAFIVGLYFERVLTILDKHTRKVQSQLLVMKKPVRRIVSGALEIMFHFACRLLLCIYIHVCVCFLQKPGKAIITHVCRQCWRRACLCARAPSSHVQLWP